MGMGINQTNNMDGFAFSELIKLSSNNFDCFINLMKKGYIMLFLDMLFYIAVSFLSLAIFVVIAMIYTKVVRYIAHIKNNRNEIKL